ncbi:MAG: RNA polymerase factor sigma-54 [Alphaproteobacteria bacterium]|nr:RNA polymerase factor sigma-54 [Alphaproteobacteria bacterium]MCL2505419.1 RNA polymerase factor sigma-54 [Alphaproteobacteria bacterium]
MAITPKIEQQQSQTLVMTAQLQQAIKMLQMTHAELCSFLEDTAEKNPLIELSSQESEQKSAAYDYGKPRSSSFNTEDLEDQIIAYKPSLRDLLTEQINIEFSDPSQKIIAFALSELLDDAGYIASDFSSISKRLSVPLPEIEAVLQKLQQLEPSGIFARSLKECLAIQLKEQNLLNPKIEKLLENLHMVAKHEIKSLMRICKASHEEIVTFISMIRKLNPKPASLFTNDVVVAIIPDVFMLPKLGGGWHIELNTAALPKVLANERFYTQIKGSIKNKEEKSYISENWQQANWIVKAMRQRATTILKASTEIVKHQSDFFTHGISSLKPLTLKEIAASTEMHPSTISRVTNNKYISTPRGTFELKYFFSNALSREDGKEDMSSASVKSRIQDLIEKEKRDFILSDSYITMKLRGEGIDIARRTVAKYREMMNIPTSAQRKRIARAGM